MSGVEDLYIPVRVRNRLDARKYASMGVMSVVFGQSSPLDSPGGYNYEISAADRATLEQAVRDSHSNDSLRRTAAFAALKAAAAGIPGGPLAVSAGEFVWNLLGKLFKGDGSLSANAVVYSGYLDPNIYGTNKGVVILESVSYPGGGGTCTLKARAYGDPVGCKLKDTSNIDPNRPYGANYGWKSGQVGISRGTQGSFVSGLAASSQRTGLYGPSATPVTCEETQAWVESRGYHEASITVSSTLSTTGSYQVCGWDLQADGSGSGWSCREPFAAADPFNFSPPGLELDALEGLPNTGDPALSDLTPAELQGMIDDIKADPDYAPFLGNPEDDPGNITLPPTVPEIEPAPGTPVSGMPFDKFRLDDGIGKSPLGRLSLPGMNDPLGDRFKPGDPFSADMDGTPFDGKIGRYKPGDPAEFVGEFPPYGDERFAKNRCYNDALATDIAKELAIELGVNPNVAVTPGCNKRFTGCFKKGTSKFDAMWRMADLCGYGVFPDPDTPTIGPIEPLEVYHGPYHEMRDLFVFQPVFDSLDVPRFVSYYRPPAAKRPGSGWEAMVEVITPYTLPADKIERILAPRSMTEADGIDAAAKKAKAYERRAKTVEFAVPLKMGIKPRHQIELQRPLYGFTGNFMAWEVRHDANDEGFVTVVRGVELSRTRYQPRFEDYATAGGVMR